MCSNTHSCTYWIQGVHYIVYTCFLDAAKDGVNELLNICYTYAHKWRYRYNASKCAVHVQSKHIRQSRDIQLHYSNLQIDTFKICKHLGITQCNNRKTPASVDVVRQKARDALFGLTECGVHSNIMNPITAAKLYTTIVYLVFSVHVNCGTL